MEKIINYKEAYEAVKAATSKVKDLESYLLLQSNKTDAEWLYIRNLAKNLDAYTAVLAEALIKEQAQYIADHCY